MHLSAISYALPDAEAAALLYQLLSPYAGQNTFTPVGSVGPVDGALALLATTMARYDDAERYFAAADELCGRLQAPWSVCVRVRWAQMLRSTEPGDGSRSLTLATQALADAETLGLSGLADELRELVR